MGGENHINKGPVVSPNTEPSSEQSTRQQARAGRTQEARKRSTRAPRVSGAEVLEDAKERLRKVRQDTDDYVRKNPTKAVLIALGLGFVLGLMRRR